MKIPWKIICFLFIIFFSSLAYSAELSKEEKNFIYDAEGINPRCSEAQYVMHWNKCLSKAKTRKYSKSCFTRLYADLSIHYYNLGVIDSIRKYTSITRQYALESNDEGEYFYQYQLLAHAYIIKGSIDSSMVEGRRMSRDASKLKNQLGLAISAYIIGTSYISVRNYKAALPYLLDAFNKSMKSKDWYIAVSSGGNYLYAMQCMKRPKESFAVLKSLDSLMYCNEKNKMGLPVEYEACIWGMSEPGIYAELNDKSNLKRCLGHINRLYSRNKDLPRLYFYEVNRYNAQVYHNYNEELIYTDSITSYYRKSNDKVNLMYILEDRAEVYSKLGLFKEAYYDYKDAMVLNDSIKSRESEAQLNILSTEYGLNKLELANEILKNQHRQGVILGLVVLTMFLFITIAVISYFYWRQLKMHRSLRQQADELRIANERVGKANEIKNTFFKNMNHEIRTPLNAIVGFSDLFGESQNLTPQEIRKFGDKIHENSDKLLGLMNDILAITDFDSGKLMNTSRKPFSLNDCCSFVFNNVKGDVPLKINPILTLSDKDVVITNNEDNLRHVIEILLRNAIKFTEKGEIELSIKFVERDNYVKIKVRDTGIGVNPEYAEKIVERFFKIDSFSQGNGLGLSLCKIFVERLEGKVYLDTKYKGGALFVIELPLKV